MTIDKKDRKRFFVLVKFIYGVLPIKFKQHIKHEQFYKYIQDKRIELNHANTSLRGLDVDELELFIRDFLNFYYINILGYYYDLELMEKIKLDIEKEFKTIISE